MLQHDVPDDFVVATGETHTVREFTELVFDELGMPLRWEGSGPSEKGIARTTGKTLVEVDPKFYRPTEVDILVGDATKARTMLGWQSKTRFEDLGRMMARADDEKVARRGF